MKKEYFLMFGSVAVTLLFALGLIRWFAPQLLGVSSDLQLVQIDEKVPAFFEGVFRREDLKATEFILKDPLTQVRAKPFFPELGGIGPNDILGFRNRNVPNVADIVAIGDSQTYGNNAVVGDNWPSQIEAQLREKRARVYSMAVGGWGAVQYLDMFTNAIVFQPRVIVVAFYSGNDPLESFQLVYGSAHWSGLIPNRKLTKADSPKVTFPAPQSEWWPVKFTDGVETVFTPTLRLAGNQDHPAVRAGYDIMADVARRIMDMGRPMGTQVVFTIVPTKELVYARKVEREGLNVPEDYAALVENEARNINQLAQSIQKIEGPIYTDLVDPLQTAALDPKPLYPSDINGHPIKAGYRVISAAISQSVKAFLPEPPNGLYAVKIDANAYQISLVTDNGRWVFPSLELIRANGWPVREVRTLEVRDVATIPLVGVIEEANPKRFGPES